MYAHTITGSIVLRIMMEERLFSQLSFPTEYASATHIYKFDLYSFYLDGTNRTPILL